jgi:predicted nucleic acid-binding protein
MRKLKIYLETTMFNYYFDTDRDAHPYVVRLFEKIAEGKYEAYTSEHAVSELQQASNEKKRNNMLDLIPKYGIIVLGHNAEAERLADLYIAERVLPKDCVNDSLHIAIASVNDIDIILSLNFKHITSKITEEKTGIINIRNGYRRVDIRPPMEVVQYE